VSRALNSNNRHRWVDSDPRRSSEARIDVMPIIGGDVRRTIVAPWRRTK
jgi:hypothetical protein